MLAFNIQKTLNHIYRYIYEVKKSMDIKKIFEVIFGLVVLPILATFVYIAVGNSTLARVPGMTIILPLIVLAVGFGMVYDGIKSSLKK